MPRANIQFEFDAKPEPGTAMPIADGVHWLRMPLPFALDHINLWLFADGDGWAIVDTGVGTDKSKEIWRRVFDETMLGRPANHIIVTHLHPDHVGCAGWLAEHFDVDLWMTRDEYLLCRILVADTGKPAPEEGVDFYRAAGFPDDAIAHYREIFGFFGRYVSPLPEAYKRLYDGLKGPIGDHEWEVVVGRGHSPEHACFFSGELNLLVAGDQVLPSISANVSVYPTEPEANPLKDWIDSLTAMKDRIPADVLVLPAHGKPFRGAHERIDHLVGEHRVRLDALHDYLDEPRRAVDVFPALYRAKISGDNLIMATGEAIAHLHYLLADDVITAEADADGVIWYRRA
ncbi:MAG: MBL fold metallo-hydrolase [Woeseiaceae bacterium]|nr:MBL fold metallo-hydrolase [Woeseiaceae bacterium]